MSRLQSFQRHVILLFILTVGAIGFTAYVAINNVVAKQSQVQLQVLAPVLDLINNEVFQPLTIAETFAQTPYLQDLMAQVPFEKDRILEQLKGFKTDESLNLFVASDSNKLQIHSTGKFVDLSSPDTHWYQEILDKPDTLVADTGNSADPHIFYDVKVYDHNGKFVGVIGTSKRLTRFYAAFEEYRRQYGYEFIFVDELERIALTSIPEYQRDVNSLLPIASLDWYQSIQKQAPANNINGRQVKLQGRNTIIYSIKINKIGWTMLLFAPLELQQAAFDNVFVRNSIFATLIIFALFTLTLTITGRYRKNLVRSIEVDPLSGLANRNHISETFDHLARHSQQLNVILVDIDYFKSINDKYGHNIGDEVIRQTAKLLSRDLRQNDLVGRWGGEEFIMLIPDVSAESAIKIAERTRIALQETSIDAHDGTFHVTASFGVASTASSARKLLDLVDTADKALYQAKANGRNKVVGMLMN